MQQRRKSRDELGNAMLHVWLLLLTLWYTGLQSTVSESDELKPVINFLHIGYRRLLQKHAGLEERQAAEMLQIKGSIEDMKREQDVELTKLKDEMAQMKDEMVQMKESMNECEQKHAVSEGSEGLDDEDRAALVQQPEPEE